MMATAPATETPQPMASGLVAGPLGVAVEMEAALISKQSG